MGWDEPTFLVFGWEIKWNGSNPEWSIPPRRVSALSGQNEWTEPTDISHAWGRK